MRTGEGEREREGGGERREGGEGLCHSKQETSGSDVDTSYMLSVSLSHDIIIIFCLLKQDLEKQHNTSPHFCFLYQNLGRRSSTQRDAAPCSATQCNAAPCSATQRHAVLSLFLMLPLIL